MIGVLGTRPLGTTLGWYGGVMAARYTYDERRWNQVLLRGEAAYLGSQGNFWLHYTKLTIRYRERWR